MTLNILSRRNRPFFRNVGCSYVKKASRKSASPECCSRTPRGNPQDQRQRTKTRRGNPQAKKDVYKRVAEIREPFGLTPKASRISASRETESTFASRISATRLKTLRRLRGFPRSFFHCKRASGRFRETSGRDKKCSRIRRSRLEPAGAVRGFRRGMKKAREVAADSGNSAGSFPSDKISRRCRSPGRFRCDVAARDGRLRRLPASLLPCRRPRSDRRRPSAGVWALPGRWDSSPRHGRKR